MVKNCLSQRGPTSGPRPLVTRHTKLFVNLLIVTTSSVTFFTPKDLKKNRDFVSRLLLYVQVPHMLLTLKHYRKM
jgi:hypothetical protein